MIFKKLFQRKRDKLPKQEVVDDISKKTNQQNTASLEVVAKDMGIQLTNEKSQKDNRLRVNKAHLFFHRYDEFEWSYFDLSGKLPKSERILVGDLDNIQRTFKFLPTVIGQNRNGGLGQVFYNGYALFVRESIPGLRELGLDELANLLDLVYLRYQDMMDDDVEIMQATDFYIPTDLDESKLEAANRNFILSSMIFDNKLKDTLNQKGLSLDTLSSALYKIDDNALETITQHIKTHSEQYCLDEEGNELDPNFTGVYKNKGDFPQTSDYELPMVDGKPHGECLIYDSFDSSFIQYKAQFEHGALKRYQYFYEGRLNKEFDMSTFPNYISETNFYDSGKRCEEVIYHAYEYSKKLSKKTWYENGNPYEICHYDKQSHKLIRTEFFHENGQLSKINIPDPKVAFHQITDAWDENGLQTVKDGEGIFIRKDCYIMRRRLIDYGTITHVEIHNGHRNGISKTFKGNKLWRETPYLNGKEHGVMRTFDENGNVEEEVMYENGNRVKTD